MNTSKISIQTGLDILVKEGFKRFKGLRVGILANQASVDKNINHLVDLAVKNNMNVQKLFAPEHGFSGAMQDMEHVKGLVHPKYNIPIISLYGDHKASLSLQANELEGLDVLICDLQDIGSRYYTFHCTIAWAMAAVNKAGIKLAVIDRPNPINANDFEGNLVKKTQLSFVGAYPLPNRHGFTMGEIVTYVKNYFAIDLDLEVIWMENYHRKHYFDDFHLPFVFPSPNMPTVNTAVVYPGSCLIEGTNISEGRGTCTPFELIGAPYIHAEALKSKIDNYGFEGVIVRPTSFKPMFHKHAGKVCNGVFVHVTDREKFKPLRFYLALINACMDFDGFDFRREPYEFEHDRLAIDLLLGDESLKNLLLENKVKELFDILSAEEENFSKVRKDFLRYS